MLRVIADPVPFGYVLHKNDGSSVNIDARNEVGKGLIKK